MVLWRRISRILAVLFLSFIIAGAAATAGVWLWARHHYQAADEALKHHRLTEARKHIELCLKIWPNSDEVHFIAGRTARRALDFKRAERHFSACKRLFGKTPALEMEQALIKVQQGEVDQTEAYFRRQVESGHPDAPLILEAFVEGYLQLHRLPEASACLAIWEKLQQDNMFLYFLRGSIRERIPNLQEAADDYRKVLELNPNYDEARLRLARVLLEGHECSEAISHLQRVLETQPTNSRALVLLGRCYMDIGRPEEARPALEQALAQNPQSQTALLASAQLAMQEGANEEAEKLLRRGLLIDAQDRETNFVLAQCLLRQPRRKREADEQMARFKRIEDDWKTLHEITTKKMGENPHDPDLQYQVGVLALRLGEDNMGIEWLKRALDTNPRHEAARKALADYYQRVGGRDTAGPREPPDSISGVTGRKDELSSVPR
jgi:tetratricopeptide (TPR) repeat protein